MKQPQDSNNDDHPKQQHLRDDDDERDDITVTATKKILSNLTDDELFTEIRSMVLRGLLAPEQQQQKGSSPSSSHPSLQSSSSSSSIVEPSNSTANSTTTTTTPSSTTPISSNNNDNNLLFPSFWRMFQQEMRNISTNNTSNSSNDDDDVQQKEEELQQQQQQQQSAPTIPPLAFTISQESETYQNIMSTVNWYRDNLFIGSEYADKRGIERSLTAIEKARHYRSNNSHSSVVGFGIAGSSKGGIHHNTTRRMINNIPMSNPETAILHPYLLSSITNYLQSTIAVDTLRPYTQWLVSSSNNTGPLFPLAKESLAQTILWSQTLCDDCLKDNLLWVLTDEEWKEWAKTITSTYVATYKKNSSSSSSSNDQ